MATDRLKKEADDINCIGESISVAVEARMKSERMKTELITNVSHDIKTPLTSIINYVDLLKKEADGNEKTREYEKIGMNLDWVYDPDNFLDSKKKEEQNKNLDLMTLEELADKIDEKILYIRSQYVDNSSENAVTIGTNLQGLFEELSERPEMGPPMYGPYINTVTRGMRNGKFYLRSAATGVGKSRTMIADACFTACTEIYDLNQEKWISTGAGLPCLFISTELEISEIQTMCVAFLSGIDEEKILTNEIDWKDSPRIQHAIELLQKAPLYIEELPDFSLKDIENTIKRNIRLHGCQYICLDYIHTSMKILEEITRRSGGVKLREDNILFLLSVKLKDICNKYHVFIISSTQLNKDYQSSETPDQNLLRGAKSIADKIDTGMILLDVTQEDLESLNTLIKEKGFPIPNVKMSIYKNRRGSYNKCYLWMKADKSICRFDTLFCTDYNYNYLYIKETITSRVVLPNELQ